MLQASLLTYHNSCTPLQHCLVQWLALTCCPAAPSHGAECRQEARQSSHLQGINQLSGAQVHDAVGTCTQAKQTQWRHSLGPLSTCTQQGSGALPVRPANYYRVTPGSPDSKAQQHGRSLPRAVPDCRLCQTVSSCAVSLQLGSAILCFSRKSDWSWCMKAASPVSPYHSPTKHTVLPLHDASLSCLSPYLAGVLLVGGFDLPLLRQRSFRICTHSRL